jgi:cytochrome P450
VPRSRGNIDQPDATRTRKTTNMATQPSGTFPVTDVDLFDDAILLDPYDTYTALRGAGPAVWSTKHNIWILSRFADVKEALRDNETYISGKGVGLYQPANEAMQGTVIASDPPEHTVLRRVLADRMSPRVMRATQSDVEKAAKDLVDRLMEKGSFDAVPDLAERFPLMVAADLIGLPGDDHGKLLAWADAGFNTFGPENDRTISSMPKYGEMFGYIGTLDADPTKLRPGSMGRAVYEAADRGELRFDQCGRLIAAFLMAGLDTTVSSLANAVWLFAQNPDQWDIVRSEPARIPHAYNEILRIESPVQAFRRTLSRNVQLGDTTMRAGDPVLLLYGSANRDERHWDEPTKFDVRRRSSDHVALGFGIHNCAGQGLARLEAHALLAELASRVERFETGTPKRHLNNVIRNFDSLPVTLVPAAETANV